MSNCEAVSLDVFVNEFNTTVPAEASYAQATWSKTESFVIPCQRLYFHILRRLQSGCEDADFSVSFCGDDTGLRCFVCCFVGDVIRGVCVLWKEPAPRLCDAEIKCLSQVFAILPANQSPVSVRGCFSTLLNVFMNWRKAESRPVPLPVLE